MGYAIQNWYKTKCKKEWKIAFLSAVIIAFLVHMYKFTNALPNHDTLYNYFRARNRVDLGRWFLCIGTLFSSDFSLPWFNSVIVVLFLALATVLIVDLLEVKNPFVICIVAGLLITYPATTGTLFYQYTADVYAIGLFLACLAVRLMVSRDVTVSRRKRVMTIGLAAISVALATGIYQSYLCFALMLSLSYFVRKSLQGDWQPKPYVAWIRSQIIMYGSGVVLYYAVWKVFQLFVSVGPNTYQGISEVGFSVSTIVSGFKKMLIQIVLLFTDHNPLHHGLSPYGVINGLFLALAAVVVVLAIRRSGIAKTKGRLAMVILALLAMPISVFLWYFTSSGVWYRCIMLQSVVVLYILVAVLCEEYLGNKLRTVAALLLCAVIMNNAISANIAYFYLDKAYSHTYVMAAEINMRIHEAKPDATKIAIVGDLQKDNSLYLKTDGATSQMPRMLREELFVHLLLDQDHVIEFTNHSFGENYQEVDDETMKLLADHPLVQDMGVWPAENSVAVIDNIIVIKV